MTLDLKHSPPPTIRRLVGLGIAVGGGVVTWLVWRQATTAGEFSLYGAIAGPAFAVLGLGLVLFPGYREERLRRGEDISQLEGLALLTPRWHAVLGVSGVAAVINLGFLKGWW